MKRILFFLIFLGCGFLATAQNNYTKRRTLDVYSYKMDTSIALISFPHSDSLNFSNNQAWTFETWVKLDNVNGVYTLYNKYASLKGILILIQNGVLNVYIRNYGNVNGIDIKTKPYLIDSAYTMALNDTIQKNAWVQIVVTYDGSQSANGVKIYYNNKVSYQYTINNNLNGDITNNAPVIISAISGKYSISATRMFKKKLTDAELKKLYNNGVVNYNSGISRKVLDMQVRNDTYSTNWNVIDSALGNNGTSTGLLSTKKIRVDSMYAMLNMPVQTYTGNSIYYKTFGVAGNEDTSVYKTMFSPLSARLYTPIIYDYSNQQTYIVWQQRPKIGFDRQTRLLKILHNGKMVTPSGYGNYIYPGQYETHAMPSVTITPSGEILMAHEEGHNTPIYIERTIGKSQPTLTPISIITGFRSYPQFRTMGGNIYLWLRGSNSPIRDSLLENDELLKSTDNGTTWSRARVLSTRIEGVHSARPYTMSIYDSSRLRYMVTMRNDGLAGTPFTDNYYIQSNDGITFYNIDSSFSKNIIVNGYITKAEMDANFLAKSGGTSNILCKASVITPTGKTVSIINNGTSGNDILYRSGGAWVTKTLPLTASSLFSYFVLYPYSDSSFVFWRLEGRGGYNVVVEYRTTDFFNTVDAGTIISDTNVNHEQINGTFNINDAGKIVIAANAIRTTGNDMFIYEFTP